MIDVDMTGMTQNIFYSLLDSNMSFFVLSKILY